MKEQGGDHIMEYANLNIRTPKETKIKAERIFDELGITTTTAFNIFLKQVIRTNGIPFELVLDTPNEETIKAIKEADEGKDMHGPFHDVKSLMESLNADD